jgi:hypothetical protein
MENESNYARREENISRAYNQAEYIERYSGENKALETDTWNEEVEGRDGKPVEITLTRYKDPERDPNIVPFEKLLGKILSTKMFIELPGERLDKGQKQGQALKNILDQEYTEGKSVLDTLSEYGVSLAIAMQEGFDTDPLMAQSLKRLNEKGIKPTLWLVLDDTLGYWTNKANVKETIMKLERMIAWSQINGIEIDKVGLDYEPPIELLKSIMNFNIPNTIKETYKYIEKSIKNHKELGNLQNYIDEELERVIDEYDISIETYAAMEPLRSISNWLTLKPNKNSETVTMAYTSALKKDPVANEINNPKIKERMRKTLSKIDKDEIPALGIVGSDPSNTPGRDLRGNKLEKHLSLEELTYNFREILGKENPFNTHAVFALDSAKNLKKMLKAREDAISED